jgi:hypothetical protein
MYAVSNVTHVEEPISNRIKNAFEIARKFTETESLYDEYYYVFRKIFDKLDPIGLLKDALRKYRYSYSRDDADERLSVELQIKLREDEDEYRDACGIIRSVFAHEESSNVLLMTTTKWPENEIHLSDYVDKSELEILGRLLRDVLRKCVHEFWETHYRHNSNEYGENSIIFSGIWLPVIDESNDRERIADYILAINLFLHRKF